MYNIVTKETQSAEEKEEKLRQYLKKQGKVLIAYSGGVDSTYLMAVAAEVLVERAGAVLVKGAMLSEREGSEAVSLAARLGFPLTVLELDILALEQFLQNPPDRCYYCKKEIFSHILAFSRQNGYSAVFDGTNFSDQSDFRPGRRALAELSVLSPLREVGLTKADIRGLSRRRDLPTWDKPAMACLASRIPYGDPISERLLRLVEEAEWILAESGFRERRVRVHGDLARIEVPESGFPALLTKSPEIVPLLEKLGFRYVTLDLMGLRSGSLNPPGGLR